MSCYLPPDFITHVNIEKIGATTTRFRYRLECVWQENKLAYDVMQEREKNFIPI